MFFRDVIGEDELEKFGGRVKEMVGLFVGGGVIYVDIFFGEGMFVFVSSNYDDGVIGELMKGILISRSLL